MKPTSVGLRRWAVPGRWTGHSEAIWATRVTEGSRTSVRPPRRIWEPLGLAAELW